MNYDIIKKARKKSKITQAQLAEKLGINRATLSKYETGQIPITVEQMERIANILNINIFELLSEASEGKKYLSLSSELSLYDFFKYIGFEFIFDYDAGDGKERCLCIDHHKKKLFLVPADDAYNIFSSVQDFSAFYITKVLSTAKEIEDTEGWFINS